MTRLRNTGISHALLLLLSASSLSACSGDDRDATTLPVDAAVDAAPGPAVDNAPDRSLDAAAIVRLETLAERAVAAGIPGVSVAVVSGEQTVLIARGLADLATEERLSPDHRFRVTSIAKSVVASVVLQLVQEGQLSLDDTVEDWLPGMVPENADARIEDLLRLQSGIFSFDEDQRHMAPYRAGDFGYTWTPEELVGLATEHPALFEPGERFYYSNTNYVLLGLIVQKLSGDSLDQVVRQRITQRLGMSSASMATGSALQAPYSHGYLMGLGDEPLDVTDISASSVFGNGNLISTALDVARFYGGLVGGQLLSPDQLPAMFSSTHPSVDGRASYGMGVWLSGDFYPCGRFVGHDGAGPGYLVTAQSREDGSRQFAVLTNSLASNADLVGDERAQQAFKELVFAAACE